jgi:hypothetical protein
VRKFIALTVVAGCCVASGAHALPPPKFQLEPVRATPKRAPEPAVEEEDSTATTTATVTPTPKSKPTFTFRDSSGTQESIPVVTRYQPNKIVHPFAKYDRRVGASLMRAATIAQERARAHSRSMCWHYVKEALVAAGVVATRPKTELAKDAAEELVNVYGFRKLPVRDPYLAPIGSVLVYGARRAAGHIEFRTRDGFVSDFMSKTPSRRPLVGVYAKL